MTFDVRQRRLARQRLVGAPFARPEQVVGFFGAVQAQDFAGAKWGVGQRTRGATDEVVEDAFRRGLILRTHVMRPTWHFVLPADIRWLLALTAPRVLQLVAWYFRKTGLDARVLARSDAAIVKALSKNEHLTREELALALAAAGIPADGPKLGHVIMHAELRGAICSGPRRGKRFTYALLDERAPPHPERPRDEALAELTLRYFDSHGPALIKDFVWWSGLTVADAKRGIASLGGALASQVLDDETYFFTPSRAPRPPSEPVVSLLPNYDEYLIAYKQHRHAFDEAARQTMSAVRTLGERDNVLASHFVVCNGRIVGGWRRVVGATSITVEARFLERLSALEKRTLDAEVDAYAAFMGTKVSFVTRPLTRR